MEHLTAAPNRAIEPHTVMTIAGQAANRAAQQHSFADYTTRKAANTVKAQRFDLRVFCRFLGAAGIAQPPSAGDLQSMPVAWTGITWGLVAAFVKWQLQDGYSISSLNRRLSTVKTYARLATQAGVLDPQELALIQSVTGYGQQEAKRVNAQRTQTRQGRKKATPVALTESQVQALKTQPDTPQGRRDRLLLCLLLDHGLRAGEVAALQVEDADLAQGLMTFVRPKVDQAQTHKLSADTLRALWAWFDRGDAPTAGPLLRASRKGGQLTSAGMTPENISKRVCVLGARLGIQGLSAHDCRHYWATHWAGKVDLFRLQEAGGWNSLAMPRRYVARAQIANEGMV
jgi:integrase